MKYYLPVIFISTLFLSCVSQDRYDKLNYEKQALQDELKELKFGAPNLLQDAKTFFQNKDFVKAKERINTLLEKHSDRPESAEARAMLVVIYEEGTWDLAANSNDLSRTEQYISQYPNGKYIVNAKERLQKLIVEKEQSDYAYALSQNTSSAWKDFLKTYPNRSDLDEINKRIIKNEVDEIMGSTETGKLPSFNQTSYGYSSSSEVSIANDTNCELIVRYSGADIKMVEIPAGSKKTVYLQSGSYRIAASACGYNYAGSEDLHGNYSSSYYISSYSY